MPGQTQARSLTKADFFAGFLAAVVRVHGTTIRAQHSDLHIAFHKAFSAADTPTFRELARATGYGFDPLYGQSDWLAAGIAQAARDMLVELPTALSRWNDIVIRLGREEAGQRLDELCLHEESVALANAFVAALAERQLTKFGRNFFLQFAGALVVAGGRCWTARYEYLLPAFRHALGAAGFPVAVGHPVENVSDTWLFTWFHGGLGYLRGIELLTVEAQPFFREYRVRSNSRIAEEALDTSGLREEYLALARSFLEYLASQPAPEGMCWGAQNR